MDKSTVYFMFASLFWLLFEVLKGIKGTVKTFHGWWELDENSECSMVYIGFFSVVLWLIIVQSHVSYFNLHTAAFLFKTIFRVWSIFCSFSEVTDFSLDLHFQLQTCQLLNKSDVFSLKICSLPFVKYVLLHNDGAKRKPLTWSY